jgi:chaperone modulatory protein CbpM
MKHAIHEVAEHCGLSTEQITQFIVLDWVHPFDLDKQIFDDEDLARIRFICDLQNQFGVNNEAIPIILHLVDQLNRLHLEVSSLA